MNLKEKVASACSVIIVMAVVFCLLYLLSVRAEPCPYGLTVNVTDGNESFEVLITGNGTLGNYTVIFDCSEATAEVYSMNATIAARENEIADLRSDLDAVSANLSNATSTIASLAALVGQQNSTIQNLTATYVNWEMLNATFYTSNRSYTALFPNFTNIQDFNFANYSGVFFFIGRTLNLPFHDLDPGINTFGIENKTLTIVLGNDTAPPVIDLIYKPSIFTAGEYSGLKFRLWDSNGISKAWMVVDNVTYNLFSSGNDIYEGNIKFDGFGGDSFTVYATDPFNNTAQLTLDENVLPRQIVRTFIYSGTIASSRKTVVPVMKAEKETEATVSLLSVSDNESFSLTLASEEGTFMLKENESVSLRGQNFNIEILPIGSMKTELVNKTVSIGNGNEQIISEVSFAPFEYTLGIQLSGQDSLDRETLAYAFNVGDKSMFTPYYLSFGDVVEYCAETEESYVCNATYPKYAFDVSDVIVPMPAPTLEQVKNNYEYKVNYWQGEVQKRDANFNTVVLIIIIVAVCFTVFYVFKIHGKCCMVPR